MYMRSTVSWSLEDHIYVYQEDSLTDATTEGQQRVYFVLHGVAFYPLKDENNRCVEDFRGAG